VVMATSVMTASDRQGRSTAEPCSPPPLQRLELFASRFFEPDMSSEESEDPFVYMAARHPVAGARFVKFSMLFGVWSGALVCGVIGIFLATQWSKCTECDRPLRWWLVVHMCLQLGQIAFRLVFFRKMHFDQEQVDLRITSLAKTPAWRASHRLSLHTFAWLVLGIVWIINTSDCSDCPWLLAVTCLAVFQSCARVGFVLVYFKILFPEGVDGDDRKVGPEPASPEQIAALPVEVVHSPPAILVAMGFCDETATCAVCLSDHSPGDNLRKLPCSHKFHVACCDQWLQRSKRCPLCMRAIDEVPHVEAMSRCPRRMKID